MLKVFEVEIDRADVTHFYYSEGVAKTTKNCVILLHDNKKIKREIIPSLYCDCRKRDHWKYIGNLVSDMTDQNWYDSDSVHNRAMRHAANRMVPE